MSNREIVGTIVIALITWSILVRTKQLAPGAFLSAT